ncbi:MAG: AAA family ATPase [Chromatiaceae bacterium]|nr:AAA family ATPase [Gammaproteobacteria bacterium]MCP5304048.1 AAA family ATPase [Chromatiaceae bacterium]MCP5313774.1 AAA family ATPase [Chromatiaceae bacterium]
MKILGVYNIKGGVGKTATAVNLGHLAASSGLRTLIWDLDPQAAATFYLRVKPKVKDTTKILRGKRDLDDVVKGSDFANLDLLPSDFSYRNMDLLLGENKKPALRLLKLLRPMADQYDLVVLDCPPSISLVSENIFRAADALLLPTIPTTLSLRTLEQLLDFMQGHALQTPVYTFYSMVDRRKRLHQDVIAAPGDARCTVLDTTIPYASEVERMGLERRPVTDYAPRSTAARAYRALWDEVRSRVGGLRPRDAFDWPF